MDSARPPNAGAGPEPLLDIVYRHIADSRWDAALDATESLLRAYPNFRLGHLIKGDLLLARRQPLKRFGEGGETLDGRKVTELREEAIHRLRAYRNRPDGNSIPRYLLQMAPEQKTAIVADLKMARMYLYRNDSGIPRLVADYYISHGQLGAGKKKEGDKRTPIGVYRIAANLPRQSLSSYYGNGAFPIDYPNEWDKKNGRDGHGIWLHGTPPDTYSRPPKASDGCVVVANADLDSIAGYLQIGLTPMIIADGIEWLSLDDWHAERKAMLAMIEAWRRDWESLDADRFAQHYAREFASEGKSRDAWLADKRRLNANKQWIKLKIDNISMFRSPGPEEYIVVTFDQDYQSSNFSHKMRKRQYWIKEDGRWKIAQEGAVATEDATAHNVASQPMGGMRRKAPTVKRTQQQQKAPAILRTANAAHPEKIPG